ncbi:hypothetical protein [Erwinia rhapontici]|uniref:hypothetical protein n=1 Tax=Erwinia rhapontici TaxID=55212 RepID=UPI0013319701|nr:hypothetical protein [Erwinia rhapontici]MBP2157398.1 hypothetical protein [Erwinia rhapontici]
MVKKMVGLSLAFCLGWAGCTGYFYFFTPHSENDVQVVKRVIEDITQLCRSETTTLLDDVTQDEKLAKLFIASNFSCLSAHSKTLIRKLSLSSIVYDYLSCDLNAEGEGTKNSQCKKDYDEAMLRTFTPELKAR